MTYHSTPGHTEDYEQTAFIADLLIITGGTRVLVVPVTLTGTTVTDSSGLSHHFTAPESVATWITHTARAPAYDLNGSTRRLYQADSDDFSFGNGATDSAFSVFCLFNADSVSGDRYLIGKQDYSGSKYEWHLHLTNGKPYLQIHDVSESAHLARYKDTAFSTSTWYFVVGTYSGSSAIGGLKVYIDGVQGDDTSSTAGSYVAMENSTAGLGVGCMFDTYPAGMSFFDGRIAVTGVCAKELSANEVWSLNTLVRGYFGV